jgi:hypothetical protein
MSIFVDRCVLTVIRLIAAASLSVALTSAVRADTGVVRAVLSKAAFVVGAGAGRGTLIFHDQSYPLSFAGMSIGATIGLSTAKLTGRAYHMQKPTDIEGTYTAIGAGAAVALGGGSVRLQNAKGVVLELAGARVGVEFSIAFSGVRVRLR